MAKRFADTQKYDKKFIRHLPGPYKLLWDYLTLNCDYAGIWYVDFEVAQIKVGEDMPVNEQDALKHFNNGEVRIIVLNDEKKWFFPTFLRFQYGLLNPNIRLHNSIIELLLSAGIEKKIVRGFVGVTKELLNPYEGPKDKDKEKEKIKERGVGKTNNRFDIFWQAYPKKKSKGKAEIAFKKINPGEQFLATMLAKIEQATTSVEWTKEHGQFIPYPATWLNAKGWEDIFIQPEEGKEVEYLFCENCNISLPEEITKCPGCKSDKHLKKRVMKKYGK